MAISNLLCNISEINSKLAPKAARYIKYNRKIQDGWILLHRHLCNRSEHLGGDGTDLNKLIATLRVNRNEDIHQFYERATELSELLPFTRQQIDATLLPTNYIKAMAVSPPHLNLLQQLLSSMDVHSRRYGPHTHILGSQWIMSNLIWRQ